MQRTLTFSSLPTMAQRQGDHGQADRNPLTGEVYANGVIPQSAITPFARKVLAGLPAPTRPGISNNYDSLPRRQDYNDKFDIKLDQQFSAATNAFVRFSHRKVNNFEPPPIPGETEQPGERLRRSAQPADRGRLHAHARRRRRCSKSASASRGPKRARPRSAPAARTCSRPTASPGLPTDAVFTGGLTQQSGRRLDGVGPPEQQSAVPESVRHRRAHQLLVDPRPPHA